MAMIIRPVIRIMVFVIRLTDAANNKAVIHVTRTEFVDDLTWYCLLMRRWREPMNAFIVVHNSVPTNYIRDYRPRCSPIT